MELKTLTVKEVLRIHEILIDDFMESNDPISPAGVRNAGLLESAVSRQWTSLGNVQKYAGPMENASTLLYGLCGDHPFHNGNKRTALVAMLAHLDKNKLTVYDTTQRDFYEFMVRVASHKLGLSRDRRRRRPEKRRSADAHPSPHFSASYHSEYFSIYSLFGEHLCELFHQRTQPVVRPVRDVFIEH